MKKLFLSYYSRDVTALSELATELHCRGIVPWVDKDGGFSVGDESEAEAQRAIREDCFGLLLYATRGVFDRRFIAEVEIPAAIAAKELDPAYLLFAVPVGMQFPTLYRYSQERFGTDLSRFHSHAVRRRQPLIPQLAHLADDVLDLTLRRKAATCRDAAVSLQFSTREELPDNGDDMLRITAVRQLARDSARMEEWQRLLGGLCSTKRSVAAHFGRPRVRMHGSKHLTAAFLFGRVFAPFIVEVRQGGDWWRSDATPSPVVPFTVAEDQGGGRSGDLFLEISAGVADIGGAVMRFAAATGVQPAMRLRFTLTREAVGVRLDESLCVAMAGEVRRHLTPVLTRYDFQRIHLFFAGPQALAVMVGHQLRAAPSVHCYEYDGLSYRPSAQVPSGAL